MFEKEEDGVFVNYVNSSILNVTTDANSSLPLEAMLRQLCALLAAKGASSDSVPKFKCLDRDPEGPLGDSNILRVGHESEVILCLCFVLVMITAVLGNALVILTVSCNRSMWSSMHMFILSLAVSDILLGATCIPLNIVQVTSVEWNLGSLPCRMIPYLMEVSVTASMLILCCMAVNRYLAIVHPLKFTTVKTVQTSIVLSTSTWLVAALISAPYAFYYDVQQACYIDPQDGLGDCPLVARYSLCQARDGAMVDEYHLKRMTFSVLFLLPALVMTFTYGIIVYTLWVKAPVGVVVLSVAAVRSHYKRKAIKMLILVFSLFIVCWSPLLLSSLVDTEEHLQATARRVKVRFYFQCLALSSTAWNPIVYAFMNQKFRASFKNILLRHRKRISPLSTDKPAVQPEVNSNCGLNSDTKSPPANRHGTTKETRSSKV